MKRFPVPTWMLAGILASEAVTHTQRLLRDLGLSDRTVRGSAVALDVWAAVHSCKYTLASEMLQTFA